MYVFNIYTIKDQGCVSLASSNHFFLSCNLASERIDRQKTFQVWIVSIYVAVIGKSDENSLL
jgi:hypothetical protein